MKKIIIAFVLCVMCTMPKVFADYGLGSYDVGLINSKYMEDIRKFDFRKENAKRFEQKHIQTGNIEAINFLNNRAFSEKDLQEVVSGYVGIPMNSENIMKIRRAIMKFYQTKGYYSAVAIVEAENANEGTLLFRLDEGGKDSIQVDE